MPKLKKSQPKKMKKWKRLPMGSLPATSNLIHTIIENPDPLEITDGIFNLLAIGGPEFAVVGALGSAIISFFKTSPPNYAAMSYQEIVAMRKDMAAGFDNVQKTMDQEFGKLHSALDTFLLDHKDQIMDMGRLINFEDDVKDMESATDEVENKIAFIRSKEDEESDVFVDNANSYQVELDLLKALCLALPTKHYSTMVSVLNRLNRLDPIVDEDRQYLLTDIVTKSYTLHRTLSTCIGLVSEYETDQVYQTGLWQLVEESSRQALRVVSMALNQVKGNYIHNFRMEADIKKEYGAFDYVAVHLQEEVESETSKPLVFLPNPNGHHGQEIKYNTPLKPFPIVEKEIAEEIKADPEYDPEAVHTPLPYVNQQDSTWGTPLRFSTDNGAAQVPDGHLRLDSRLVRIVIQPRGFNNQRFLSDPIPLTCHDGESQREEYIEIGPNSRGNAGALAYSDLEVYAEGAIGKERLPHFTGSFRFYYTCGFGNSPAFEGKYELVPSKTFEQMEDENKDAKTDDKMTNYALYRFERTVQAYLSHGLQRGLFREPWKGLSEKFNFHLLYARTGFGYFKDNFGDHHADVTQVPFIFPYGYANNAPYGNRMSRYTKLKKSIFASRLRKGQTMVGHAKKHKLPHGMKQFIIDLPFNGDGPDKEAAAQCEYRSPADELEHTKNVQFEHRIQDNYPGAHHDRASDVSYPENGTLLDRRWRLDVNVVISKLLGKETVHCPTKWSEVILRSSREFAQDDPLYCMKQLEKHRRLGEIVDSIPL